MYEKISKAAYAMQGRSVTRRRDFHKYPETGWLEMRTSAIIAKTLTELGYEVLTGRQVCLESARMGVPDLEVLEEHAQKILEEGTPLDYLTEDMKLGYTGVVGILRCGEGPTVGLRFDIDALGLIENKGREHRPVGEGFASVHEGMMHACGHDGHAAIGLGTAEILMQIRDQLHGTVKVFFQPGEEGARGARAMVEAGHLDDVDYFVGSHIAPDDGTDDGDITPGTYGSLATTKYDVVFHGTAAHAGGFPEKGHNALLAAASASLSLAGLPRHSEGASRINVGTFHAGTGRNVIPDEAKLQLEVRGETTEINTFMSEMAERVCHGAADMYGCSCDMIKMGAAESQHSDLELVDKIAELLKHEVKDLVVSTQTNVQNWGSEDISFMMNRVQEHGGQAIYMRATTPMASAQHTTGFDFDELVLARSIEAFAAITYMLLK